MDIASMTTGVAAAASASVVSLFIPFADQQPLAASIVQEDSGTTTYSINCPPGTDSSDCGMGQGLWLTAGPVTTTYIYSHSGDGTPVPETIICSVGGTTTARCTASPVGFYETTPFTTETIPLTKSDMATDYLAVTITAGPGSASDASSTAVPTISDTASETSTGTKKNSISSVTASASATHSVASSSTSNAGFPQITGNTFVALGGAAAVLAAGVW